VLDDDELEEKRLLDDEKLLLEELIRAISNKMTSHWRSWQ